MFKSFRFLPLLALFFLAFSCEKDEALVPSEEASFTNKAHVVYTADLKGLNASGVMGTATLTVLNGMVTVEIEATGLVPDEMHPQHIHGHSSKRAAVCPPPSADRNDDGMISVGEGAPFYGGILLSLDGEDAELTLDADGNYFYSKTFPYTEDLGKLQKRAIVLHGGMFDGAYNLFMPVACGKIELDD